MGILGSIGNFFSSSKVEGDLQRFYGNRFEPRLKNGYIESAVDSVQTAAEEFTEVDGEEVTPGMVAGECFHNAFFRSTALVEKAATQRENDKMDGASKTANRAVYFLRACVMLAERYDLTESDYFDSEEEVQEKVSECHEDLNLCWDVIQG